MASGIRVQVQLVGTDAVRRMFSPAKARRAVTAIAQALLRGALRVEGDAKRNAPVRTGRLRASITHSALEVQGDLLQIRVGTNVTYAPFVEFGTGIRGAASPLERSAREAMREMGYVHGGGSGSLPPADAIRTWAKAKLGLDGPELERATLAIRRFIAANGVAAQPFLFPALELNRPTITDDVAEAFRREVEAPS